MTLKGLIFNNFYYRRMWCLERTDFGYFPLGKDVMVVSNFGKFYFERV